MCGTYVINMIFHGWISHLYFEKRVEANFFIITNNNYMGKIFLSAKKLIFSHITMSKL